MTSAGRRADIRAAEKLAAQLDAIRQDVIVGLMSHPNGRMYVQDLLASTHIFHTSFSDNTAQMCFAEGERSHGLRLLADIMSYCPEKFVQMMREHNARELTARADAERQPDDEPAEPEPDSTFNTGVY
jgi:hypothetical protein